MDCISASIQFRIYPSTKNASSALDLIPHAWKVYMDGTGTRVGSLHYPLVRVFGNEFAGDWVDTIVGRRHGNARAQGTRPGGLNRFGSEGYRYARSCNFDCFAAAERRRCPVADGCNALHPLHRARIGGEEPGYRGCALDKP